MTGSDAKQPVEIDDAIVLLLGLGDEPEGTKGRVRGVTRLEKLLFLAKEETDSSDWLDEDPNFEPYNFGPFSRKVYEAVDMLASAGLLVDSARRAKDTDDTWEERFVISTDTDAGDPFRTRDFQLTDRGWKYFQALLDEIPPQFIEQLATLKSKFGALPLRQLVRYVYQRYPAYTEQSIIRDEILGT